MCWQNVIYNILPKIQLMGHSVPNQHGHPT